MQSSRRTLRGVAVLIALGISLLGGAFSPTTLRTTRASEVQMNQTLSAGIGHLCAVGVDGKLRCWGYNGSGQLGDGTTNDRELLTLVGDATTWMTVSAAFNYSCGIRAVASGAGTLWCWGLNDHGQLGLGDRDARSVPTQVGSGTNWLSVSAGRDHTCAVTAAAQLYCWGRNDTGQIGSGTAAASPGGDVLAPLQIKSDTAWSRVAGNYGSTLAVDLDGHLWAWGTNDAGQLGDGTTIERDAPTQIGSDTDWAEPIAARLYDWHPAWWAPTSSFLTCALKSNGSLWCSGDNWSGNFGDGTEHNAYTSFTRAGGATATYKSVGVGDGFTCGVRSGGADDGTLWCWGWNGANTVSSTPLNGSKNPMQIGSSSSWTAVAAGASGDLNVSPWAFLAGACAMDTTGAISCWGSNEIGQQGRGFWPRDIGGSWQSVTAGNGYACGVLSVTNVGKCWGTNSYGRMATGSDTNAKESVPALVDNTNVTTWVSIAAARYLTCGIAFSGGPPGSAWCWGSSRSGGLGNGDVSGNAQKTAVRVGDASCTGTPDCPYDFVWSKLSVGYFSVCGIASGELWCWGEGGDGELGDGASGMEYYTYYAEPHRSTALVRVGAAGGGTPASDWIDISSVQTGIAGGRARCGIREVAGGAGTLWCWGGGPIGGGSTIPAQIGTDSDWTSVDLGSTHACALKSDGTLWCWGDNYSGELGFGNALGAAAPTQVGEASDWISVALGWSETCGIRNAVDPVSGRAHTLYCWGDNNQTLLGESAITPSANAPLRVATDFRPDVVSMTGGHACVLGEGKIGCHGANWEGQLGGWLIREGTGSTLRLPSAAAVPVAPDPDVSAPTARWASAPSGDPRSLVGLQWRLQFSESVTGLTGDDLSNIASAPDCVFAVASADADAGLEYAVTVEGCGAGGIQPRLAAGSVDDTSSNAGPTVDVDAAAPVSFEPRTGGGGGGSGDGNDDRFLTVLPPRFGTVSSDRGFNCEPGVSSCAMVHLDHGSEYMLTTSLTAGYRLARWNGCSRVEAGACVVVADADHEVSASYSSTWLTRFVQGTTRFRSSAAAVVRAAARQLKSGRGIESITITGYSSKGGTLASQRAKALLRALRAAGVTAPITIVTKASTAVPSRRAKAIVEIVWGVLP